MTMSVIQSLIIAGIHYVVKLTLLFDLKVTEDLLTLFRMGDCWYADRMGWGVKITPEGGRGGGCIFVS